MTEQPYVELRFDPETLDQTGLRLPKVRELRGDPQHVINHALVQARLFVIEETKRRVSLDPVAYATDAAVRSLLDVVWGMFVPSFRQILVPMMAAEYAYAFQKAQSHDIDLKVINALAVEHSDRLGNYFNETSRESLLQGFNTFVNRKVPARQALERALMAYGMTPRQMSGYTSLADQGPIKSAQPRNLTTRVKEYIGRSIRQRFSLFAKQEAHNLDAQASQVVWLYMVQSGQMDEHTEKVWLTAKDERVCPVCGPLHGRVAQVDEPFITEDGAQIWVPGAHVNCRCRVRVRHPFKNLVQPMGKALDWEEEEHPRAGDGRFRTKNRVSDAREKEFMALVRQVKTRDDAEAAALTATPTTPGLVGTKGLTGTKGLSGTGRLTSAAPALTSSTLTETQVSAPTLTSAPAQLRAPSLVAMEQMNPQLNAVALGMQLAAATEALTEQQAKTKTVTRFTNTVALPHSIYYYDEQGYDVHDRMNFDSEARWYTDVHDIAGIAMDTINYQITEDAHTLMENAHQDEDGLYVKRFYTRSGDAYADLNEDQVRLILTEAVFQDNKDQFVTLEVIGNEGRWSEDKFTPANAARELFDKTREQYVQNIYHTRQQHDRGGEEIDFGSRAGYKTWRNTGTYVVVGDTKEQPEYHGLIRWIQVDPDVAIEEYEEHEPD